MGAKSFSTVFLFLVYSMTNRLLDSPVHVSGERGLLREKRSHALLHHACPRFLCVRRYAQVGIWVDKPVFIHWSDEDVGRPVLSFCLIPLRESLSLNLELA